MSAEIQAPERLTPQHDVQGFDSGVAELDDWLRLRSLANDDSGASRTYVVVSGAGGRVAGYYALATGGVSRGEATGRVRRNMPDPIPVMVLARLAVDRGHQGKGLGAALLRDALLRTLQAAELAGIRAVLVHAFSEESKRFYLHYGFAESPVDSMTLMVPLAVLEKSLGR